MHKFYLFVGKFFTVIFAVLFVITLTLVLILYGPGRLLFQSSLYKNALSDVDVYNKIPAITSNFLPTNILLDPCAEYQENCGNIPTEAHPPSFYIKLTPEDWQTLTEAHPPYFFIKLTPENWQGLLEIFLPSVEIQRMTESALDGLFIYLHGNVDQISISMVMLKNNLTGTAGEQGMHRFFNSLSPCNLAESAQLSVPYPTSVTVPLCKPADVLLNLLIPNLGLQLEPYINRIPDEIIISLPAASLSDIRLSLGFLNWIPWISLLPLPFLPIVTLLGVRSFKGGLRLWGILLFISGLLALGVGLAFRLGANAALNTVLELQNTAILTPELISLLRQLGEYLLYHLTDWIIYPALLLFLIGLVAWISSALIRKKANGSAHLPSDTPLEVS